MEKSQTSLNWVVSTATILDWNKNTSRVSFFSQEIELKLCWLYHRQQNSQWVGEFQFHWTSSTFDILFFVRSWTKHLGEKYLNVKLALVGCHDITGLFIQLWKKLDACKYIISWFPTEEYKVQSFPLDSSLCSPADSVEFSNLQQKKLNLVGHWMGVETLIKCWLCLKGLRFFRLYNSHWNYFLICMLAN